MSGGAVLVSAGGHDTPLHTLNGAGTELTNPIYLLSRDTDAWPPDIPMRDVIDAIEQFAAVLKR